MDEDPEARLVAERATAGWLRGDVIQALAPVSGLAQERYKVRGLDADGHPKRAFTDTDSGGYVAVRGDHPDCAAVRVYRAAAVDHAWLVVTTHRVAVLRLRDRQSDEPDPREVRSLRGLGKFVKDSATEFVRSMRRPPLAERPADAALACSVELPRQALRAIERWKQPLVPEFSGGPRFVQVHFTDNSWARVQTTEAGQSRVLGG